MFEAFILSFPFSSKFAKLKRWDSRDKLRFKKVWVQNIEAFHCNAMDWMWIVRDQDIMWFYVYLLCNSCTCVRYEQHTRLSLTPRAHKHTSTNTQAQTEKHTSSQARAQKLKQALIPISGWLFKVRLEKSLLASVVSFWHRSDITGVALRNIFSLVLCFLLCTSTCFTEHGQKHQRNHYERGGAATS